MLNVKSWRSRRGYLGGCRPSPDLARLKYRDLAASRVEQGIWQRPPKLNEIMILDPTENQFGDGANVKLIATPANFPYRVPPRAHLIIPAD